MPKYTKLTECCPPKPRAPVPPEWQDIVRCHGHTFSPAMRLMFYVKNKFKLY